MLRDTRPVDWIKAARKAFEYFPSGARGATLGIHTAAADGGFPDYLKPMKGMGPGVYEIALPYRGDAYRVICTVQFKEALWVIHAFQKKSKPGIKTPQTHIGLVRKRLAGLKEESR
ncbi:MAG: type II toxin-antitoxin system RelE/ParE family toxin [Beijerinckiaceae bacterium]|nr:type II toxin-antitoxin system RelE/ParE family toxin [Beijerinckiaceae bacterium]